MKEVEEKIREAAKSHRLIEITAKKKDGTVTTRVVEPYTYRVPARENERNKLLVCYDVTKQGYRSFSVGNIMGVKVLDTLFEPRDDIDL